MKSARIVTIMAVIALTITVSILMYMDNADASPNYRPKYDNIIQDVFKDLPDYPANFVIMKRDIYDGQITDFNRISDNVFKQPELYPTWENNGQKWFIEHDYSRWGVHGYGFFPGEISYTAENMTADDAVNIYSFLHTSWGIETWQGLKLVPQYDPDYFDVQLTPDEVLLEPTFPKFYENWTQKINMRITAKESVPAGTYKFSIQFTTPSSANSDKWMWEALDEYTDRKYHDEIQKCIASNIESKQCNSLIELRQNKYVSGNTFEPSRQFTVELKVN